MSVVSRQFGQVGTAMFARRISSHTPSYNFSISRRPLQHGISLAKNPNTTISTRNLALDNHPSSSDSPRKPWLTEIMRADTRGTTPSEFCSAGDVLKLIDLAAAMAAKQHAKDAASVVTLSFDRVDFQVPVFSGDLLSLDAEIVRIGRTSLAVLVTGTKREPYTRKEIPNIFRSLLTFVALDLKGKPCEVPPLPQSRALQYKEMAMKADARNVRHAELETIEAELVSEIRSGNITWADLEEPWNKEAEEKLTPAQTQLVFRHMFLPRNINVVGSVFGGDIVEWMEECSLFTARHFSKSDKVKTVSMHRQYFLDKILPGDVVECTTRVVYTGKHTIHVIADVNTSSFAGGIAQKSHVGHFVIVNYDRAWKKERVSTGLDLDSTADRGTDAALRATQDYGVCQMQQNYLCKHWTEMLLL
eukprot:m.171101 g.171101  ORF g.171101 m.171101 type:complete len:417 (+) comp31633_c0_seq1:138-1388(+)